MPPDEGWVSDWAASRIGMEIQARNVHRLDRVENWRSMPRIDPNVDYNPPWNRKERNYATGGLCVGALVCFMLGAVNWWFDVLAVIFALAAALR